MFFSVLINNTIEKIKIENNISKIKIATAIITSDSKDDEELYFSTNQNFSQFDLIRNYTYKSLKEIRRYIKFD